MELRIKKLDLLILKSFIGPFFVTFFISLFVLVMQFFWLYMDELIGKGLGLWMITQLLLYMSTTMVPLALPLGILLASIMTFGNMGENFELVAIKSSGVSLLRFMRPLFIFMVLMGVGAFVFNNNVIPVANLKALSLLYDLRNSKPTFNIRPGQFNNEIKDYSIRVGSKDPDGSTIRDIVIYDHSMGVGNEKVTLAKEGRMIPSEDKQFLVFRLKDGWRYEEGYSNGSRNYNQVRMHFEKWDKIFDLSFLRLTRTNEDLFKGAYQMMNVSQLKDGIDSLERSKKRITENISSYLSPYFTWAGKGQSKDSLMYKIRTCAEPTRKYDSCFAELVNDPSRKAMLQTAINNARNSKSLVDVTATERKLQNDNYLKYMVEWHRKFTLSFACILLFLIGAPLGAIIRKGGIGMPLLIATIFFVFFLISSKTGENLALSGTLNAWMGMWLATATLLPIALVMIRQARNDSQIFSKEWYNRLGRFFLKLIRRNRKQDAIHVA